MGTKTRFPSPTLKASVPWNVGKMVGAKRALKEKHVWAIRFWLENEQRIRDKALFDPALNSKLRGCDLVAFVSATSLPAVRCVIGPWLSCKKPSGLCSLRLRKRREKARERGWSIAVVA
ncbi:hypothetical protein [Acetobacter aceti]|uniref:hypothetical protein n=1 Tax=Acetobacter aceti TaxID=435 RepID=UPI001E6484F7|nr:hypothetical protein [Acetobacter aceti]